MTKQLQFEGADVAKIVNKLAGEVGDARMNTSLHIGDAVLIVLKGTVDRVTHEEKGQGLVRVQRVVSTEAYFVEDETDAADLLHKLRADRERSLDELLGNQRFDTDGD